MYEIENVENIAPSYITFKYEREVISRQGFANYVRISTTSSIVCVNAYQSLRVYSRFFDLLLTPL